jgi:hypothetical protein
VSDADADRFCSRCGAALDVDARYCAACGRPLSVDNEPTSESSEARTSGSELNGSEHTTRRSHVLIIGCIVLLCALVGVIAIAAIVASQGGGGAKANTRPPQSGFALRPRLQPQYDDAMKELGNTLASLNNDPHDALYEGRVADAYSTASDAIASMIDSLLTGVPSIRVPEEVGKLSDALNNLSLLHNDLADSAQGTLFPKQLLDQLPTKEAAVVQARAAFVQRLNTNGVSATS